MSSEFELIRRHFTRPLQHSVLGVGDDCAILAPRAAHELLVSTDMLVAGTHFQPEVDPAALGWKTAAVNLSDIAAMGGQPRWITLALSLPEAKEAWIAALADGFAACCAAYDVDWVGGDTTRGPLNLCATVFGEAPSGSAIRRNGAQVGDEVWISGMPGLAALGLRHLLDALPLDDTWRETCLSALHRPQPRIELGLALRGIASAMQDVSDGLAADLAHILAASACGATLQEAELPLQACLQASQHSALARQCLLHGGDDYELIFTAAPAMADRLHALAEQIGLPLQRIGQLHAARGLYLQHPDGSREALPPRGYDHFAP